jgi:hypothetical protein
LNHADASSIIALSGGLKPRAVAGIHWSQDSPTTIAQGSRPGIPKMTVKKILHYFTFSNVPDNFTNVGADQIADKLSKMYSEPGQTFSLSSSSI